METGAWSSSLPQPLADLGVSWHLHTGLETSHVLGIAFFALAAVVLLSKTSSKDSDKFPLINPSNGFEILGKARREDYNRNAGSYINEGFQKYAGKPFKVLADHGEVNVLPPAWVHDIRNMTELSFTKAFHLDFHADLAPFMPLASGTSDDQLLQSVARKQLTKYLNKVTEPLSAEIKFALDLNLGSPSEWQEFPLQMTILDTVARISSRVFLGSRLCRNEEWLEITKTYTVESFLAAEELRAYPRWLRGIMHLYNARCRQLEAQIERARVLVGGIVQERRDLVARGEYKPEHTDAIDWFEEEAAGRPYDPTSCQLMLSVAAIHTTTELANGTLLMLAQHPDVVDELRQEMVQVLSADGWKKISLFNMKLLDSTIKETQRLNQSYLRMTRLVVNDVTLPDGSVLRKGERAAVATALMRDPHVFDRPNEFDPYRFARYRDQEELKASAHLVSTSPTHLGFGHGNHACPGRFFAANELKILLCHILMKFDLKLPEGYVPQDRIAAQFKRSDPASRMMFRARTPEIDIDALEC